MLATYAVRGVLAIADDNDSPGSRPILQGLGPLAGLRDGQRGGARDDDDAVTVPALRHRDRSGQDRVLRSQVFRDSVA